MELKEVIDKTDSGKTKADIETEYCSKTDLDNIDKGWAWVILSACWITQMLAGSVFSAAGIIHIDLLETFQESDSKTALVGGLLIGLQSLLGPFSIAISNRWSYRTCIFIGGVVGSGGLAVGSIVSSLWMAILSIGVFGGIGLGLVLTPVYTIIGFSFERRRNFASASATVGFSVGSIVAPICLAYLGRYYGWRGSLLIFSGILLNVCVMATLMRPSSLENRHCSTKSTLDSKMGSTKNYRCSKCFPQRLKYFYLAGKSAYLMLVLTIFLSNMGYSIVYVHMPIYTLSRGGTMSDVHGIYTALGFAGIASKVLTALGSGNVKSGDSIDRFCLLLGSHSIAGTALCVLPSVSHTQLGRVICFGLMGFYYNVEPALYVSLTMELVGLDKLGSRVGFELLGVGIGLTVGPPLAASVHQLLGDYKYSFYVAGLTFLFAATSCVLVMFMKANLHHDNHRDEEDTQQRNRDTKPYDSKS